MSNFDEYTSSTRHLMLSIRIGDFENFKNIIKNRKLLEIKDSNGNTPLILSAKHNHTDIAKYLINIGADTESHNLRSETTIHWASFHGNIDLIKLLINSGANPNCCDCEGGTPASWAAYCGKLEVIKYLCEIGCNLIKSDNNNSCLHWACSNGHLQVVKYLITIGLNLNQINNYGETPLDLAEQNEHYEIVNFLGSLKKNG